MKARRPRSAVVLPPPPTRTACRVVRASIASTNPGRVTHHEGELACPGHSGSPAMPYEQNCKASSGQANKKKPGLRRDRASDSDSQNLRNSPRSLRISTTKFRIERTSAVNRHMRIVKTPVRKITVPKPVQMAATAACAGSLFNANLRPRGSFVCLPLGLLEHRRVGLGWLGPVARVCPRRLYGVTPGSRPSTASGKARGSLPESERTGLEPGERRGISPRAK